MARGGRRKGQTGKPYPNRSDMRAQKVSVAPSAQYGQGVQQRAAEQALPLPSNSQGAGVVAPPASSSVAAPAPEGPQPGTLGFTGPSARPGEPLTTGLPIGAGAGPESAGLGVKPPSTVQMMANGLEYLIQRVDQPSQELLDLYQQLRTQQL